MNERGGMGCLTVLGLIFIVLKLTDLIDWSWWWVLVPFWGPVALTVTVIVIVSILVSDRRT